MFTVKSNIELGSYLKDLILRKYKSIRQFCKEYLNLRKLDSEDPQEIRRLTNRFSQIINGKKSIQTYDLPLLTELLMVSCEDILSCGENIVPLTNRRTNYSIASSTNKVDWEKYLTRDDRIAAYADEYGKTVVDYAIEFKNYDFIKYLINNDYIVLVSDNPQDYNLYDYGAKSNIKARQIGLHDEFATNKRLRTHILALAIANNDTVMLEKFKAREIPPQATYCIYYRGIKLYDYFDEQLIKEIAKSKQEIFDFFLEEYEVIDKSGKHKTLWLYPFIGELAIECLKIKNVDRAIKAIDISLRHNQKAFESLKKIFLFATKKLKDELYTRSFQDVIDMNAHDYEINEEKNFVQFKPFHVAGIDYQSFNFIHIDYSYGDKFVQTKIDSLNETYEKILNLPKHIIKQ